MRIVAATLVAPLVVPACFRVVLPYYVQGSPEVAAPLLPGMLGVILWAAYLVTLFVGVPAWVAVSSSRRPALRTTVLCGVGLGLAAGLAARITTVQDWPVGLLLWSGGLGGGLAAAIFQLVAGPLPTNVVPQGNSGA